MTNRKLALIAKNQDPLIMAASETVQRACQRMWNRRVGAVLVLGEDHQLAGIFTGRDAVRTVAERKNSIKTTLANAMTADPDTISPDQTAIDALRKMSDCGYRHLPIVANGQIVGIVSRSDFTGAELDRIEGETHLWERIG